MASFDKKYVDSLLVMKERYTKSGNLEAALSVDSEIKKTQGNLPGAPLPVADQTKNPPKKISLTEDFRQLLLSTKWTWSNVSANVPDRECVFMPDGTFRHPNFTAKFTIKDMNVVELNLKGGGKAVMTFDSAYMTFEALDFDRKRITGHRVK